MYVSPWGGVPTHCNLFVQTNISPPHLTTQLTLAANREARNVSRRGRQP